MADNLDLKFTLNGLPVTARTITKAVLPTVSKTIDAAGRQLVNKWAEEVQRAKLWSGEKDAYAQSISWKMTGDFKGEATATYKHARQIEEGRPARDLKKMLGTSLKVRRSTKGNRFLVIPFRHNIKSMSPEVYAQAKALAPSKVVGMTQRKSGEITGYGMQPAKVQTHFLSDPKKRGAMMVQQAVYKWGGRIAASQLPASGNRNQIGMVRMDTSSGKQKSSAYLTFRVMSEKSKGWIVPKQPGLFIVRKVTHDMKPKIEQALGMAVAHDIKNAK